MKKKRGCVATACCLCVFLVFADVGFADPAKPEFATKDSIALQSNVPASWSFEVTLTNGALGSQSSESLDALISRIENAAIVRIQFAKKTVFGTLVFMSKDSLTTTEVAGVRNRISILEEVTSIRTRRLPSARASAQDAPVTAILTPAVGFIIKPTADAEAEGWVPDSGSRGSW